MLGLPRTDLAKLLGTAFFVSGLTTVIQNLGILGFGNRLPVMMGVTFAAIIPALAIANSGIGLPGIFGAVLLAAVFGILVAPLAGWLLPFFPAVVNGSILIVLGLALLRTVLAWILTNSPGGSLVHLALPGTILVVFLVVHYALNGRFRAGAGPLALLAGLVLGLALEGFHQPIMSTVPWVSFMTPLAFGRPVFHFGPSLAMILVTILAMLETMGMYMVVAQMTGEPSSSRQISDGLRAGGLGTLLAGILGAFPCTSLAENIPFARMDHGSPRGACTIAGGFLVFLGCCSKAILTLASLPSTILGGVALPFFGLIAVAGFQILGTLDFRKGLNNLAIVIISVGLGMIPALVPRILLSLPRGLTPLLSGGFLLTMLLAVLLNLIFNGAGPVNAENPYFDVPPDDFE